jgi:sulfate adenylyltransferase subunit 2
MNAVLQVERPAPKPGPTVTTHLAPHLARLESESIHIIREVVAESRRPGLLYSIGKDSSVLLHLIRKAFHPAPPPFPLLHIDTGWKFREMIAFRDATAARLGLDLIVHTNEEARARGVNPFDHGASYYTHEMKTVALREALRLHRFDAVFGGARRDEEKSRAKERVVSVRTAAQEWDPHNQRAEFWQLYNSRVAPGESVRAFPLSNWTELDIWQYLMAERIPVVPLYFAAERPVVERDGSLIMVDDDRMALRPGETVRHRSIRFRSLGCYPLTGAMASEARTIADVVDEMRLARTSERSSRLIDHDGGDSMERKKREGYF